MPTPPNSSDTDDFLSTFHGEVPPLPQGFQHPDLPSAASVRHTPVEIAAPRVPHPSLPADVIELDLAGGLRAHAGRRGLAVDAQAAAAGRLSWEWLARLAAILPHWLERLKDLPRGS